MPEQLSPCHRHVDLLDAIGAKNDDEAKQMVNGMRTRLHTALNDAAGAGMLLEAIRSQLKCETVLDIPEAIDALIAIADAAKEAEVQQ